MKDRDYRVENRLTVADVVTGGVLLWVLKLGMMKEPSLAKNNITRLMERTAFD
ncbi:hypothetical protein IQ235_12445 [Oscillatoriales cyanobacterium LEGE 11467]|uniref:Uncharacterized protein n=1 Tax=Zarconia navalis LEGE 11467 TaxID=1828826 RepID=A0A928Z8H2_9CYAN|nr:hypothetical protein [Zarconia navalis]MBE9041590.1 hypothetical protein [Zarconia navalis LEGE 11467]